MVMQSKTLICFIDTNILVICNANEKLVNNENWTLNLSVTKMMYCKTYDITYCNIL